jgi:hypothetical protein
MKAKGEKGSLLILELQAMQEKRTERKRLRMVGGAGEENQI